MLPQIRSIGIIALTGILAACEPSSSNKSPKAPDTQKVPDEQNPLDLSTSKALLEQAIEQVRIVESDLDRGYLLNATPDDEAKQIEDLTYQIKVSLLVLRRDLSQLKAYERFDRYVKRLEEVSFNQADQSRFAKLLEVSKQLRNALADYHDIKVTKDLYFHDFKEGVGKFNSFNVAGNTPWQYDESRAYMKISGFKMGDSESWLLSPRFDLSNIDYAFFTIRQTHAFFTKWDDLQVLVSSDYAGGDPSASSWTPINIQTKPGEDEKWSFVTSEQIDITRFSGGKLVIGFRYRSTNDNAATWEIDELTITGSGQLKELPLEGFASSSIEKVVPRRPAPKPVEVAEPEPTEPVVFEALFASDLAPFKEYSLEGEATDIWGIDAQFATSKASGFKKGPNVNWLVSPVLTLASEGALAIRFSQAVAYFTSWDDLEFAIAEVSDDFVASSETLKELAWQKPVIETLPDTTAKWAFSPTGDISLDAYLGKNIIVAFKYKCDGESSPGWEVKNFRITGTGKLSTKNR
jgi:hypothetical protein